MTTLQERALDTYVRVSSRVIDSPITLSRIILLAVSLVIVLVCLAFQWPFVKWARATGSNRFTYWAATLSAALFFILELAAVIAAARTNVNLSQQFYIIFIFITLTLVTTSVLTFYLLAELVLRATEKQPIRMATGLLTLLAVADFAMEIVVVYNEIHPPLISTIYYYSYISRVIELTFALCEGLAGLVLFGIALNSARRYSRVSFAALMLALFLFIAFFALLATSNAIYIDAYKRSRLPTSYQFSIASFDYVQISPIPRDFLWAIMYAAILTASAYGLRRVGHKSVSHDEEMEHT